MFELRFTGGRSDSSVYDLKQVDLPRFSRVTPERKFTLNWESTKVTYCWKM